MLLEDMISNHRADCSGCSACENICPKNCISMARDSEGFAYPKINHEVCISCGKCDKVCPALNFKPTMPDKLPDAFVAIYPDEKVRRHSSSGGAFTALSELVLSTGGIIFGAGFNENWQVVHTSAENPDELENLRGSKYVQSQIGDVYKRVKAELEKGRRVLFSGTPCQCAGLKSFLDKDYDNLLTVEIICHGTPSPLLWENYIEYIARGHDIAHVNFRSKRFGWTNNHLEINFFDCGFYAKSNGSDLYLKNFLQLMTERPSCHECKFKFPNGKSDITIGDAWGVQNFAPKFFDDCGTSLVIIHTAKGRNFLSKTKLEGQQVNFDVLLAFNPCFLSSSIPDANRQNFFNELKESDPVAIMQKYFQQPPQPENGRNTEQEVLEKFVKIIQQFAKRREKNLLLIIADTDITEIFGHIQFIKRKFKDSGIYHMQVFDFGKMIFIDCIYPIIKQTLETNIENMQVIFEDFNITNIYLKGNANFLAVIEHWLKNFGIPIERI